jgi:hypothetical protein
MSDDFDTLLDTTQISPESVEGTQNVQDAQEAESVPGYEDGVEYVEVNQVQAVGGVSNAFAYSNVVVACVIAAAAAAVLPTRFAWNSCNCVTPELRRYPCFVVFLPLLAVLASAMCVHVFQDPTWILLTVACVPAVEYFAHGL